MFKAISYNPTIAVPANPGVIYVEDSTGQFSRGTYSNGEWYLDTPYGLRKNCGSKELEATATRTTREESQTSSESIENYKRELTEIGNTATGIPTKSIELEFDNAYANLKKCQDLLNAVPVRACVIRRKIKTANGTVNDLVPIVLTTK